MELVLQQLKEDLRAYKRLKDAGLLQRQKEQATASEVKKGKKQEQDRPV